MARRKTKKSKPADDGILEPEEVIDRLVASVDEGPGVATRDTEAAKQWLHDWRLPLVSVGASKIAEIVSGAAVGQTDAALRAAYASLDPKDLNKVLASNAEELAKLKSAAQREAGLWAAAKNGLSVSAASYLARGVLQLTGLGLV